MPRVSVDGDRLNGAFNFVLRDGVFQGAVPEPATWATMILGLGMIGGVARGRRRAAWAVSS